jgi:tripartite-type tricarboxylate transporter receptor subunit TctC
MNRIVRLSGIALLAAAAPAPAQNAADFPSRPVRWLINTAAGGGADLTARAVATKLSERLGHQIVVDNRPGGAGNISLELLARAPANGYTMAVVATSNAINRALVKNLPYDLLKDFTGVTQLTSQPYCLSVNPNVPAKTVRELVELARAKPNTLTYGSAGNGSLSHLGSELLAQMGKFKWIHVPYKGGAQGIADTISGQITAQLTTIIGTWGHMKAGRLRWLAVSSANRSKVVPDLPTIAESGFPGYDVQGWYAIAAPAGTPAPILEKMQREIAAVLKLPEVGGRFAADGSEPVGSTPAAFTAFMRTEADRYAALTRQIGMRVE